jgi:hypothetical protein
MLGVMTWNFLKLGSSVLKILFQRMMKFSIYNNTEGVHKQIRSEATNKKHMLKSREK